MVKFSDLNPIEPITRNHDRKSFSCGSTKLDNYLRDRAIGDTEKHIARVFVLTLKENPETIVGYYALSSLSISLDGLPEALRKVLPNYKVIGSTLLGKLAVAEGWQRGKCNLRVGEHLLIDAMRSAWMSSRYVASFALVVDVLISENPDPTGFYTKNHFIAFMDNPNRLFLPMHTVERTLRASGIIS